MKIMELLNRPKIYRCGSHTWTKHYSLTHWGRVTHICASKITIIGSDNGSSPGRRQTFIWTNAGILLILASGTNFSEILSEIHTFSFKKMHLKMSSEKRRPFCLGLNVLSAFPYIFAHIMTALPHRRSNGLLCSNNTCRAFENTTACESHLPKARFATKMLCVLHFNF